MMRALPSRTSLSLIFAAAFATALSGAVVPGSLLLVVIQKSLQFGWAAGPLLMIGHGVLELVAVILLAKGLLAFARSRGARGLIGIIGGAALLWLGIMSLNMDARLALKAMSAGESGVVVGLSAASLVQLVTLGAVMSAVNPYWWLWWATIGTAQIGWAAQRGRGGGATYWIGHVLGDVVWYSVLSVGIAAGSTFLTPSALRGTYLATAGFLLILGIMFGIGGIRTLRGREAART